VEEGGDKQRGEEIRYDEGRAEARETTGGEKDVGCGVESRVGAGGLAWVGLGHLSTCLL
jgi:hypothetical protein